MVVSYAGLYLHPLFRAYGLGHGIETAQGIGGANKEYLPLEVCALGLDLLSNVGWVEHVVLDHILPFLKLGGAEKRVVKYLADESVAVCWS